MLDVLEEKFDINSSDEDILETFSNWLKDSSTLHDYLLKKQEFTEEYYHGNQTFRELLPSHKVNSVENRLFEGVETIVPIATASAHQFVVIPGSENELSLKKAQGLQKVLGRKYESLGVQELLEQATRDVILKRFAVLKWCWSYEKDDVSIERIDPRFILIPDMPEVDPHSLPYKIELQEYSRGDIEKYWPKVDIKTLNASYDWSKINNNQIRRANKEKGKLSYKVFEVWNREMVAWICSDKILEKIPNPYWDFEGEEKKEIYFDRVSKKKKKKSKLIFRNHLDLPSDPYVFVSPFGINNPSLAEQVIDIQDLINTQKRNIVENLKRLGNGQVYIDSDAMTQEQAENLTDEIGLAIRGDGVASENKVRREPGVQLPNAHFANLQHTEGVFDNIMGIHAATRGNANSKTLGQDILSRQQDFTRVDLITRSLNRGVYRLANGLVQLMKLYYTDTHVVKILGEDGAIEFIKLNQDDIEDHIEVDVKSGVTLPMDEVSLRTEAVQLWQLGGLDPVTLFERLKFPNPAKSAERLLGWKSGQLTQETMAKIAEIREQAKMSMLTASKGSGPSNGEKKPAGNSEERGVETPQNVMQRATANLGGGAPSLPEAPKL